MLERRDIDGAEVRATKSPTGTIEKIGGRGVVYNSLSLDLGGFRERFLPGAFASWLASGYNIRSLFNHNADVILGDTRTKTLRLSDGSDGLSYEVDLPATQTIQDMVGAPVERGTIAGNSFQFAVRETEGVKWEKIDGEWIRNVSRAEIYEIGPVVFPAYPQTDVAARSFQEFLKVAGDTDAELSHGQIVSKIERNEKLSYDEATAFRALMASYEKVNVPSFSNQKLRLRAALA